MSAIAARHCLATQSPPIGRAWHDRVIVGDLLEVTPDTLSRVLANFN
jgi:hypothetical protein